MAMIMIVDKCKAHLKRLTSHVLILYRSRSFTFGIDQSLAQVNFDDFNGLRVIYLAHRTVVENKPRLNKHEKLLKPQRGNLDRN